MSCGRLEAVFQVAIPSFHSASARSRYPDAFVRDRRPRGQLGEVREDDGSAGRSSAVSEPSRTRATAPHRFKPSPVWSIGWMCAPRYRHTNTPVRGQLGSYIDDESGTIVSGVGLGQVRRTARVHSAVHHPRRSQERDRLRQPGPKRVPSGTAIGAEHSVGETSHKSRPGNLLLGDH